MTAPIDAAAPISAVDSVRLAAPPPPSPTGSASKSGDSGHGAAALASPSTASGAGSESSTRLLVEAGKGAQPFVYKIVDRSTGQVLSEIPHEAAASLAAQPSYAAGAVVDESA